MRQMRSRMRTSRRVEPARASSPLATVVHCRLMLSLSPYSHRLSDSHTHNTLPSDITPSMALFPPGQAVVSTYSASPSFLSSPDWASIRTAVRSHLPLRNLHWKPASRPSLRTIQSVDVEFRALEMGVNRGEDSERPGPGGSFLEKPLLNIYFVTCEVSNSVPLRIQLSSSLVRRVSSIDR